MFSTTSTASCCRSRRDRGPGTASGVVVTGHDTAVARVVVATADRDGVRVDIVDVRYAKLTGDGFGTATVFLDRDLNPLRAEVR